MVGEAVKDDSPGPPVRKQSKNNNAATSKPKSRLPPFLDHFNSRDLKTLFRCSVAFWVASLFIFIEPTLVEFGQATFFGCIVTVFLPPSGVVFVFLLGGMTMILGMALGWAWGVITMKAALAARPAAETNAQLQALAQQASSTGTSAQILIYEGFMLDTRVTAVWFCMLGLFLYLMARLRMKAPKLTLTVIFSWIVSDIFFTTGPLLPTFNGTIPSVLIKPAAAALAINVACSILIFPESTSHLVLAEFDKLTNVLQRAVPMISHYLADPASTDDDVDVQALKGALIGCWTTIQPALGFLSFDFSFGYWGAHDIETLKEPLRRLLITTQHLLDIQLVQHESRQKAQGLAEETEELKRPHGRHQVMESLNLLNLLRESDVERSVKESYQALSGSSGPLLEACNDALITITNSIHAHNTSRWFNTLSEEQLKAVHQEHSLTLEDLRAAIERYHKSANAALLESHEHLFDENGSFAADDKLTRHKLTGLFIGLSVEDRVGRFAESIERVLAQIQEIESKRPRKRLWMPSRLDRFFSWALGSDQVPSVDNVQADVMPELDKETKAELQSRIKSASRPARKRPLLSRIVLGTTHWLINDEGIFAARIVIATIAIAVIAANKNTAGFFYREKGLWALIMAQTGMVLQFADFSVAVVTRILGTVVGGVVGMVGWYIGSGNGPGNPYGLGAVTAVISVVIMYLRLFAPPQFLAPVMISVATFVLVIGYSYVDTHNPSYGNPGVGYEVFWRRTVLVIIGFAASFIVCLIPWPTSSSRFVTRSLSKILHSEADHYAVLLSSWQNLDETERLLPALEAVVINTAESLGALGGPIGNLKFEFSSSAFDSNTCGQVKQICDQLNRNLAVMHVSGTRLPQGLRDRFAKASGILHHSSIANIMAVFSVAEQALKTGDALPSRLPTPLVKACLEHGHGSDVATLTKDMLRDKDYRTYTILMSSYLGVLSLLDDLVLVLKGALGESYYVPQDLEK